MVQKGHSFALPCDLICFLRCWHYWSHDKQGIRPLNKCSAVAEVVDHLATIDTDRNLGGGCAPLEEGELGPHLTQCCLRRGLPPYQVASWSIQPFGHNRYRPKIGGAGSPSNTMLSGRGLPPRQSFILIHPTVWPQHTNTTNRTGQLQSDSIGRTVLHMVRPRSSATHP